MTTTTIPTTTAAVPCLWCDHTETGDGPEPHERLFAHQAEAHGRRKQPCGCQYVPNDRNPHTAWHWWTCDAHAVGHIRQITAWQLANHHARRWSPAQDTLPTEQARP